MRVFQVGFSVQGQGVLSEKLRSFSMQDLTLIQDEQDLMDSADDISTGSQTLPRARSSTRQSMHLIYPTSARLDGYDICIVRFLTPKAALL